MAIHLFYSPTRGCPDTLASLISDKAATALATTIGLESLSRSFSWSKKPCSNDRNVWYTLNTNLFDRNVYGSRCTEHISDNLIHFSWSFQLYFENGTIWHTVKQNPHLIIWILQTWHEQAIFIIILFSIIKIIQNCN